MKPDRFGIQAVLILVGVLLQTTFYYPLRAQSTTTTNDGQTTTVADNTDDAKSSASQGGSPATVKGRVKDEHGQPVSNVHVYMELRSHGGYHKTMPQAYTDENGDYSLDVSNPADFDAVLAAPKDLSQT